jgi:hypothetical protein
MAPLLVCTCCHRYFAAASRSTCSCCLEPCCDECLGPHLVACRERMAEAEEERWAELAAEDEAAHERATALWLERGAA